MMLVERCRERQVALVERWRLERKERDIGRKVERKPCGSVDRSKENMGLNEVDVSHKEPGAQVRMVFHNIFRL